MKNFMNTNHRQLLVCSVVLCLAADVSAAELPANRYWFTPRVGFNVDAKFKGIGNGLFSGGTPRLTPDGAAYNYDDGYLLTDSSGNYGGLTWNVGYDDSAAQISGNTLLLSRSTATAGGASAAADADASYGFEVGHQWRIGQNEKRAWGLQTSINWQSISVNSRGTYAGNVTRVTDAYSITPNTTPPAASSGSPYQGSFGGAGFLFGDSIVNTTTQVVPGGATVAGRHELEGGMLGLHFGGYVEQALNEKWSVSLAGGLATAMMHLDGDWTESATLPGGPVSLTGGDEDWHALFGFYAGANVTWQMNETMSLVGGVQYQFLNNYSHNFDGRRAELNFSGAFYVTIGISKTF
jgi:hypothetical protein